MNRTEHGLPQPLSVEAAGNSNAPRRIFLRAPRISILKGDIVFWSSSTYWIWHRLCERPRHVSRWQALPGLPASSDPSPAHAASASASSSRFFDSLSGLTGKGWFEPLLQREVNNLVDGWTLNYEYSINKQHISIPAPKFMRAARKLSAWLQKKKMPLPLHGPLDPRLNSALAMKSKIAGERKSVRGRPETSCACVNPQPQAARGQVRACVPGQGRKLPVISQVFCFLPLQLRSKGKKWFGDSARTFPAAGPGRAGTGRKRRSKVCCAPVGCDTVPQPPRWPLEAGVGTPLCRAGSGLREFWAASKPM